MIITNQENVPGSANEEVNKQLEWAEDFSSHKNLINKTKTSISNSLKENKIKYINNGWLFLWIIPKEDAKRAAEVFGEWYKPLTDFLEICIENWIRTVACCAGHSENDYSYIMFDISDQRTKELTEFVVKHRLADEIDINKIKLLWFEMCRLSMTVPMNKRDGFYETLIREIKEIVWNSDKQDHVSKNMHSKRKSKSLIKKLILASEQCSLEKGCWGSIRFLIPKWLVIVCGWDCNENSFEIKDGVYEIKKKWGREMLKQRQDFEVINNGGWVFEIHKKSNYKSKEM